LRTNWINSILVAAIEQKAAANQGELAGLRDWLKTQDDAPKLYGVMADMLTDYLA
jgi:hypothetical protein